MSLTPLIWEKHVIDHREEKYTPAETDKAFSERSSGGWFDGYINVDRKRVVTNFIPYY